MNLPNVLTKIFNRVVKCAVMNRYLDVW